MPKPMTEDKQNIIINALNKGLSRTQIAGVVGVSKRAITRINTNLKKHGSAKPPPSGLKLGRPVRLTTRQIEAMMSWMKEREYVFYVKDLVHFLKERHGYEGCDGTVRRGLLRSGFKKRLPWHKSEVTAWLPPANGDIAMGFATDTDDQMGQQDGDEDGMHDADEHDDSATNGSAGYTAASSADQPSPLQQQPPPNIDPRLEQHVAAALSQLPNPAPPSNNTQEPVPRQSSPAESPAQASTSNKNTSQQPSTPQQPQRRKASPTKPSTARRRAAAATSISNTTTSSPAAINPNSNQTILETQLSVMQSQLAAQQDIIAQLQQQLAAAQQGTSSHAPTQAPVTSASAATPLINPPKYVNSVEQSPPSQRPDENGTQQPQWRRDARDSQPPSREPVYEIQYEV